MMLFSPSEHTLRRSRQVLLSAIVSFVLAFWPGTAGAQNITLEPPQVSRGAQSQSTVLFRSDDTVVLRWAEATSGLTLRVGLEPGEYGFTDIQMRGTQQSQFSPEVVGLPIGIYYGVLTNSKERTFTGIQIDASSDPDIRYSREIRFAVESSDVARIVEPRGTITESVPTFEWEPVSGVAAYVLVVSTTPFTSTAGISQIQDIQGLSPVWIHLTADTSVRFGEPGVSGSLIDLDASSLVPGRTYYYTVLNAYSLTDPAFVSQLIGPVVSFSMQDRGALEAPVLTSPGQGSTLSTGQTVRLAWDPVPGALTYEVIVFERLTSGLSSTDRQIFSTSTSNVSVNLPAREVLRRGSYRWFVIASDREGAASVSETGMFDYDTPMGRFRFETSSASDGADLVGVSVSVRSTDEGYRPASPFVNRTNPMLTDSLSTGSYVFTASKVGYEDETVSVTIRENELTVVPIALQPLPSRIIGQVIDQDDAPVPNARVALTEVVTGEAFENGTSANGVFSVSVTPGSYEIRATKDGYRPAAPITVSVAENQTLNIPDPFVVIDDQVLVSGRVINQDGIPVPQARILAVSGELTQETVTDGDGQWNMDLSEGTWDISSSREGFLASLPRTFSLRAGDVFTNINFVLVQQASRVQGTVVGYRVAADGSQDVFPLADATVTASPLYGEATSVRSDEQGRFLLDLGTGAYRISASSQGFDPNGKLDFVLEANETIRDVRFELQAWMATAFGTVIDGQGNRVDEVVVRTSAGGETVTSGGGAFALAVPEGRQEVSAIKAGYIESDAVTLAPSANQQISGLTLVLHDNAARIAGTARTARGPVSGLIVEAIQGTDRYETETGPDGSYSFQLPAGNWEIAIVSDRYRQVDPLVLPLRAGSTSNGIDLQLVPDNVLMAGYLSSGGQPISGVRIDLQDLDESTGRPVTLSTYPEADGSYALVIGALTTYRLTIDAEGYEPFIHTFTSPVPGEVVGFDAELTPSIAVLQGRVVRQNDTPIAGATLQARIGSTTLFAGESGFDGSFSMSVESGSYDLVVEAVGFESSSTPVQVAAGQQLSGLTLPMMAETGNLAIRVINPIGGQFVAGARVLLEGAVERSSLTDTEGMASLADLPPGSYDMTVEAVGFQLARRSILISARSTSTETFVLIPAVGSISGRVLDADSRSVLPATTIRLLGVGLDRRVQSDADGMYLFEAVPIGSYSVEAQRDGYGLAPSGSAQVTAATPGFEVADLLLPVATGRITGFVNGSSGEGPLSGVVVVARSSNGTVSTRSRTDGSFALAGLETANWTLETSLSGFRGQSVDLNVTTGQTSTTTLTMLANQGVLIGRVRASGGDALPFDVSVEIIALQERFQTFSTAEGAFSFEGLPVQEPFIVRTRMQREGYADQERTITIPAGGVLDIGTIAINQKDGTIVGNVGVGDTSIRISDPVSGRSIAVGSSSSNGSFEISNLEPATVVISPSRAGYEFSPVSRTVSVVNGQPVEANFSSTASVGVVQIAIRRSTGEGVPGIQVRISSLDRSIDELFVSDENGLILPSALPLGLRYRVEPVTTGFQFDPMVRQLDLTNASQVSVSFVIQEVNAFIGGRVTSVSGGPVGGAQVVASSSATQRFTTASSPDGTYEIGPVPGGSYRVTVSLPGFEDAERSVNLAANQRMEGIDFALQPQSVRLTGRVLKAGMPLAGTTVQLIRPIAQEVLTNAEGVFTFDTVPVDPGQSTVAEIAVPRSGRSPVTRTVSYGIADVGGTLVFSDIVLSSGRISFTLTDGSAPLVGERLDVQGPEGRLLTLVTDSDGRVATADDLDPGTYVVSPAGTSRLLPPESARRIEIQDSEASVQFSLALPYRHAPPSVVRSDEPVTIRVFFDEGQRDESLQFSVASALNGDDLQEQSMNVSPGLLAATLPAPGELDLSYRVIARSPDGQVAFESLLYRFTPVVAGQLQNLVVQPDPDNSLLRTGSRYTLRLQIRDGLGEDLTAAVFDRGSITWTSQTGGVRIEPYSSAEQLGAVITPEREGALSLDVQVRLGTEIMEASAIFAAGAASIASLAIESDTQRLPNTGGTIPLLAAGETASGARVLLGDAVQWRVLPVGAASVDEEGWLRTDNEQFIGPMTVIATDRESGLVDSMQVAVYAQLEGDRSRRLTDLSGTVIELPAGSIPFRGQLGLTYPRQPESLRHSGSNEGRRASTAGSRIVRFSLQSDRTLLGDSLLVPARLKLGQDPSIALFGGEHAVGYFDAEKREWTALLSGALGEEIVTEHATRLGDYALVAEASDLQIRHLSALPTPFSPEIAPLRIGYLLESPRPPAVVRVDILSIRGELVRRLVPETRQWPGRYGSRTSDMEILWDGLTDDGRRARNGRYLIRVEARDETGTVSRTIPVVLVK